MENDVIAYDEKLIAICQIVLYSIMQVFLCFMIIYISIYHSFRDKWTTMVFFSVFVSIDYFGQIFESCFFVYEVSGVWQRLSEVASVFGDIGSCILYLYLVATSVRPYLVRAGKLHIAKAHSRSVLVLLIASVPYIGLMVYYSLSDEMEIHNRYLELIVYFLVALLGLWNIVLKKYYSKKYIKTRCYSWTILGFFIATALFSLWLALYDMKGHTEFLIKSCVMFILDLGPLLAFIYFAVFYRIGQSKESGENGINESVYSNESPVRHSSETHSR